MKKRRIFITGGAGFIGARLAAVWAETADVCVYDNFLPQVHMDANAVKERLSAQNITIVEGDIREPEALASAIERHAPDTIYHLAADTGTGQSFDLPARYCEVNVTGTSNLVEAIRNKGKAVSRVILAGSRAVYGEGAYADSSGTPAPAVERNPEHMARGDFAVRDRHGNILTPQPTTPACPVAPASIYASTKLMQEYVLDQCFWGTEIQVGTLRLQNVYGPGQSMNNPYTGVLSIFARQIQQGKTLRIFEDGKITRDFVLVDDVVDAFFRMGQVDTLPTDPVDIGSGQPTTILDIARQMLQLMGHSPDRLEITGDFRPGDIRHALADISAARQVLGWTPQTSLSEGLARLVAWSMDH